LPSVFPLFIYLFPWLSAKPIPLRIIVYGIHPSIHPSTGWSFPILAHSPSQPYSVPSTHTPTNVPPIFRIYHQNLRKNG
jgi:hypothetical protein